MEAALATLWIAISGYFAVVYATNAWLKARREAQQIRGALYAEVLTRLDSLDLNKTIGSIGAVHMALLQEQGLQHTRWREFVSNFDFSTLASALDALAERIKPISRSGGTKPMSVSVQQFINSWPDLWARQDQQGRAKELYAELQDWSKVLMILQKETK